jgi:hypothetical protein
MYIRKRHNNNIKYKYIAVNNHYYIFIPINTIENIVICFVNPYFQLLLLCVVIRFDAARKWFPEVGVVEMIYASLTGEVSIRKLHSHLYDQSHHAF